MVSLCDGACMCCVWCFPCRWDPIFEADGHGKTFAEMDKAVKNKMSHRAKALEKLVAFFKANPGALEGKETTEEEEKEAKRQKV